MTVYVAYIHTTYCGHGTTPEAAVADAVADGAPRGWLKVGVANEALAARLADVGRDVEPLVDEDGIVSRA